MTPSRFETVRVEGYGVETPASPMVMATALVKPEPVPSRIGIRTMLLLRNTPLSVNWNSAVMIWPLVPLAVKVYERDTEAPPAASGP
jgi:hypothetical protein